MRPVPRCTSWLTTTTTKIASPTGFALTREPETILFFPGWDENNDFVSDFNQNDSRTLSNRIPDYEEPFLPL